METSKSSDGFPDIMRGGSSLILDNERGEIVRALVKPSQKGVKAEKGLAALRNHSEAERRRRERINGHLASLRRLIPGTNKMDKASLLAEVISHLKEMRRAAAESTKGILIPTDTDEIRVEQQEDSSHGASYSVRASLCCEYKHEVLSDLKKAFESLHLKTVRVEIATLGNRMMSRFLITGCIEGNVKDTEGCQLLESSVRQALRYVLDKFYASEEFSTNSAVSNKRRRDCFFNSSSSSSLGDLW